MILRSLIKLDHWLANKMAVCATEKSRYGQLRKFMIALEWTGHEAVWFPIFIVLTFLAHGGITASAAWLKSHLPVFLSFFFGLLLEIVLVIIMKLTFKRPRPKVNVMDMHSPAPSVDKYSFPSGHASRIAMLAFLACMTCFDEIVIQPFYWPIWACLIFTGIIAVSRLMLGRHFPSDVVGGLFLGGSVAVVVHSHLLPFMKANQLTISKSLSNLTSPVVALLFTQES